MPNPKVTPNMNGSTSAIETSSPSIATVKQSISVVDPEDDPDVLGPFRELHRLYKSQDDYLEILDGVISGKHRKTCKVSLKAHEVWMVCISITYINA
jgi:hypothetical protein